MSKFSLSRRRVVAAGVAIATVIGFAAASTIATTASSSATPTKPATTTTVSVSPTSVALGDQVAVSASVVDTVPQSGDVPGGKVAFALYNNATCTTAGQGNQQVYSSGNTNTLDNNGVATLAGTPSGDFKVATAGSYYWQATYNGDGSHAGSSASNCVLMTITAPAPVAAPTTTAWTNPGPITITEGTSLAGILDATVTSNGNALSANDGTITFSEGTTTRASTDLLSVGTHTLTATFAPADADKYDSSSADLTLTVEAAQAAPAITSNPNDQSVADGQSVSFDAAASGDPTPTVQWQYCASHCNKPSHWHDVSGATSTTLTFDVATTDDGNQYRAVFTNSVGSAISGTASLTVNSAPVVINQPDNETANAGDNATFKAAATGSPTPSITWQVSTDGKTWTDVPGGTHGTLRVGSVQASDNGNQFRAVFANNAGSVTSDAATLTVDYAPAVTTDPTDQTAAEGTTATFTAAAAGNPAPSVQWQQYVQRAPTQFCLIPGLPFTCITIPGLSYWQDIPGATSTSLSLPGVTPDMDGNQYRAEFSNGVWPHAKSQSATLHVTALTVVTPSITVAQATCAAPSPSITFGTVDGITYSTDPSGGYSAGQTVTVTATLASGYKFGTLPSGWTAVDAQHATHPVTLDSLGKCQTAYLGSPTASAIAACNTYGSITHPWNDGIDYTISGGAKYDGNTNEWVELSGSYTITATLNSSDYYQFANTNGWTVNGNTATTTRNVGTYTGCGYVGPLHFTAIAACNSYGSITHPWNDHVSYTISGGDWTVKQGSYTVTATAQDGFTLALPASDSGWSLNGDRTVATHTAELGAYTKCGYVSTPPVQQIAACASYGSIVHPWNDGVSYTLSGNPTYENKSNEWVGLSGAYTLTATQVTGWSFALPLPSGWTLQKDGTVTYDVNVGAYTGCGYVGPLHFTAIAACNSYGSITHPWNDHVSYTISGGDWTVNQGSYTVTATAQDGFTLALPASDSGWSLNRDRTVAMHTADLGAYSLCDTAPVNPTVTQAVCNGPGTHSLATVVPAATPGVTYTIAQNLSSVTATLDGGYQWQKGLPNGWTSGPGNTLVYDVALTSPGACLVSVAPRAVTAQAGTCDLTTGFDSPATITSPTVGLDEGGITYHVAGLTVTATADSGYQIPPTQGWVNAAGLWTYTASVTQPFCPSVISLPGSVPGTPGGTLDGVPGTTNPGQTFTATGTGFAPGATVNFGIYSTPLLLATVSADASGVAQATVTIPADFTGDHTVVAAGTGASGSPLYLAAGTTVVVKSTPTPAGSGSHGVGGVSASRGPGVGPNGGSSSGLANTGARVNPVALTQIGLLALLVGGGLLLVTRRRARRH